MVAINLFQRMGLTSEKVKGTGDFIHASHSSSIKCSTCKSGFSGLALLIR